jgi:hypothetical protein
MRELVACEPPTQQQLSTRAEHKEQQTPGKSRAGSTLRCGTMIVLYGERLLEG